jgi:ATP-dependent RNA helicase RhlE
LELWHTVIFGGVNDKPQIAELKRGVDILVATPGRLIDLLNRGFVKLDSIELFVLDEADRMLDMGFIRDVQRITAVLPKKRQTLFFSATMPPEIRKLANGLLTTPAEVSVNPVSSAVHTVEQSVYFTDKDQKRDLLVHLLKDPSCGRTIVFTRTKHGSDRVARHLEKCGQRVAAIHGNKAQNARTRALDGFRDGSIQVLVATDIAARGIDVDGITHVINFDVPNVAETYVHRIGRTGRAGKTGLALSLCDHEERPYLAGIERLIKQNIRRVTDHPFQAQQAPSDGKSQSNSQHNGQGGNHAGPHARQGKRSGARRGGHGAPRRQGSSAAAR